MINTLIDLFLHLDTHLGVFVQHYGAWIYALLFLIIFLETGIVIAPILPGDSLLFVSGALAGLGVLNPYACFFILLMAAILGDQCNYRIGKWIGVKVFSWDKSFLFNRNAFLKAHVFYKEYGGITILIARFIPFMRTFVPFVAGAAQMNSLVFTGFNILGGLVWVILAWGAGYFFGQVPFVKNNLSWVILLMVLIPGFVAILGIWRASRKSDPPKN